MSFDTSMLEQEHPVLDVLRDNGYKEVQWTKGCHLGQEVFTLIGNNGKPNKIVDPHKFMCLYKMNEHRMSEMNPFKDYIK